MGEEKPNLYQLRLQKELGIPEDEIKVRMRWNMPVLSQNSKCSISLDLPIINCKPTKACSEVCYACQGRQYYRGAIIKSLAVNRLIEEDPEHLARKMVDEAAGRTIRLAGSGELLPEHKELVNYIEEYGGSWWGFTRRVDTHKAMPRLMFSLDATTPASVLEYVKKEVPVDRRAYLRRPEDSPAPLEVAVTFPVHGSRTRYVGRVPEGETDCPAVRKRVEGCWLCGTCY
ncbi:MAG: hypothetical protein HY619_03045 [Thaumarchaeota archaeon]|nr:hypothetical protein [Nitrososphaerota archaeon]